MKKIGELLNFEKPKAKTEADEIIDEFVLELKKEWQPYYKKGDKWIKTKPVTFMAVKMKLYAIKNNAYELRRYLSECRDYKNRNGSFGKRFYGGLKNK